MERRVFTNIRKISYVKDNEQSHSDDESYFVNTIQDEEVHDTCVKLRALVPQLILVLVLVYFQLYFYRIVFPHVTIQPTTNKH